LRPATPEERELLTPVLAEPWLADGAEERAMAFAIQELVPSHMTEVRQRRIAEIDKVEREVRARLNREINYWDSRAARLREEERAGKEQRINAQNAEAMASRLVERLHQRQSELDLERQISALPPRLRGVTLVVPGGLLERLQPRDDNGITGFSEDPVARAEIERLAMESTMAAERALGNSPTDVSMHNRGWDIESLDSRTGALRLIEVKGRHHEARDVILTKNELLASLNAPEAFILSLVLVEAGFAREPVYVRKFFTRELGFAETGSILNIGNLLSLGAAPG
jgi:hypothetical protein